MVFLVRCTWRRSLQTWGVLKMLLWAEDPQKHSHQSCRCCVVAFVLSCGWWWWSQACWWPRPDGVKVPVTPAERKPSAGLSSPRQLHEDKCLWAAVSTWTSCCLRSAVVACRAEQLRSAMLQTSLKLHPLCFYFNCREMHFNQGWTEMKRDLGM